MADINNFSVNRSTPNDLVWDDESNEYVSSSDMYRVTRIDANTFSENENIVSVDLHNIPWVNNSMSHAFAECTNLIHINNISNTVTNMTGTFLSCHSLVNAPTIPNSVTSLWCTFENCVSLVNAPDIPDSVTQLSGAFAKCNLITTAPTIPNSVVNVAGTFSQCQNLTGNIFVHSENITIAASCFYNTSLTKNVYIPFKYENAVNTKTYNAFIAAGYKTDGSVCGVYLKDMSDSPVMTFSDTFGTTYNIT